MTSNQKIILGVGAVALAYYFYTKSKGGNTNSQSPSNSQNTGDGTCPQGQKLQVVNCIQAPCPSMCVDIPKSNPNLQTTTYICKDGTQVSKTIDITKAQIMMYQDPCRNNGGTKRTDHKSYEFNCGTPTMCKADEVFINCRCVKKSLI